MSLRASLAVLAFALIAIATAFPAHAEEPWLVASDIHFNPFATSPKPVYYDEDSNLALLTSTIAAMRRAEPNAPVILLTGDFLAHHFERLAAQHHESATDAALMAMQTIARDFRKAFPHTRFFVVLGNNDDPCGDYHVTYGTPYMQKLARIWDEPFGAGAYYTETYGSIRLILLNSVYWSFRYKNACPANATSPGDAELAWLQSQLRATPHGESNLVVLHIPPGVDAGTTYVVHGVAAVPFLQSTASERLVRLLSDPANRVASVVAGHVHHTEFRTLGDATMLVVPSISPIYGNSPTFFRLEISAQTGIIGDFQAYMYRYGNGDPHQEIGVPGWERVFDYDQAFGVSSADAQAFRSIHDRLVSGWRPDPADEIEANRYTVCAQDELSTNYGMCSGVERHERLLASIVAFAIIIVGFAIIQMRRKRL